MQLAPRNPSLPFVPVTPLPKATGPAPKLVELDWKRTPENEDGLVSIRWKGTDNSRRQDVHQVTKRNHPEFAAEPWYQVQGSFDDAVRAARELAVVDGYEDKPQTGNFARTSVAVLAADEGAWNLTRLKYTEGFGDGMDAIISMPIDPVVGESTSDVSIPYGYMNGVDFERPDKGVAVRFDDPRVAAVVGVDSIAVAPKH